MALSVSNMNVVPYENKRQQSNIAPQTRLNSQPQKDSVSFSSKDKEYENPVNKDMEYFSASIVPLVTSLLVGAGAHILAGENESVKILGKSVAKKYIAPLAAGTTLALTLPVALYHRSVSAFAKQKEMTVFSKEKEAEIALSGKVDDKAHDDDVDLDDAIKSYTNFEIGRNGRAVGIVNT